MSKNSSDERDKKKKKLMKSEKNDLKLTFLLKPIKPTGNTGLACQYTHEELFNPSA